MGQKPTKDAVLVEEHVKVKLKPRDTAPYDALFELPDGNRVHYLTARNRAAAQDQKQVARAIEKQKKRNKTLRDETHRQMEVATGKVKPTAADNAAMMPRTARKDDAAVGEDAPDPTAAGGAGVQPAGAEAEGLEDTQQQALQARGDDDPRDVGDRPDFVPRHGYIALPPADASESPARRRSRMSPAREGEDNPVYVVNPRHPEPGSVYFPTTSAATATHEDTVMKALDGHPDVMPRRAATESAIYEIAGVEPLYCFPQWHPELMGNDHIAEWDVDAIINANRPRTRSLHDSEAHDDEPGDVIALSGAVLFPKRKPVSFVGAAAGVAVAAVVGVSWLGVSASPKEEEIDHVDQSPFVGYVPELPLLPVPATLVERERALSSRDVSAVGEEEEAPDAEGLAAHQGAGGGEGAHEPVAPVSADPAQVQVESPQHEAAALPPATPVDTSLLSIDASAPPNKPPASSATKRRKQLRKQLDAWKVQYEASHGKPPTKKVLTKDAEIAAVYAEYLELKAAGRRGSQPGAASEDEREAQSDDVSREAATPHTELPTPVEDESRAAASASEARPTTPEDEAPAGPPAHPSEEEEAPTAKTPEDEREAEASGTTQRDEAPADDAATPEAEPAAEPEPAAAAAAAAAAVAAEDPPPAEADPMKIESAENIEHAGDLLKMESLFVDDFTAGPSMETINAQSRPGTALLPDDTEMREKRKSVQRPVPSKAGWGDAEDTAPPAATQPQTPPPAAEEPKSPATPTSPQEPVASAGGGQDDSAMKTVEETPPQLRGHDAADDPAATPTDGAKKDKDTEKKNKKRKQELAQQLNAWKEDFRKTEGREPSKGDLRRDPVIGPLYEEYLTYTKDPKKQKDKESAKKERVKEKEKEKDGGGDPSPTEGTPQASDAEKATPSSTKDKKAAKQQRERKKKLAKELNAWKAEYEARTGKAPTKRQLKTSEIKDVYTEYLALCEE